MFHQGMEDLIKEAFMHVDLLGPHVADGHYDLMGDQGEIILPQIWEAVIKPGMSITMHMWPMPEKPPHPCSHHRPPPPPPLSNPGPHLILPVRKHPQEGDPKTSNARDQSKHNIAIEVRSAIIPNYSSKFGTNKTFINKKPSYRALQHKIKLRRARNKSLVSSSSSEFQIYYFTI